MKNFYYAVDAQKDGIYYPYVVTVKENTNLLSYINYATFEVVQPCHTKKEAASLVSHWRKCHQENGNLAEVLKNLF